MSVFSSGAKTVRAYIEDIDMVMRAIPNYLASLAVIDTQGRQRINVENTVTATLAAGAQTIGNIGSVTTVSNVANITSMNGINPVNTYAIESTIAEQVSVKNHLTEAL